MSRSFKDDVLEIMGSIPKGKVATYKQIARTVGKPRAARAVGNALAKNPDPEGIPCFKVVKSNGEIGDYVKGREKKKELLQDEGIEVEDGKVDLKTYQCEDSELGSVC
ncbi:MAG: MGMT family protein [Candidatus Aenigmatarchaeota archaeon]